jgi:hypothetical protein
MKIDRNCDFEINWQVLIQGIQDRIPASDRSNEVAAIELNDRDIKRGYSKLVYDNSDPKLRIAALLEAGRKRKTKCCNKEVQPDQKNERAEPTADIE